MLSHLRNKNIPSHLAKDEEDPYALIFVINDTKDDAGNIADEADILQASTLALVDLLLSDSAQVGVQAWLEGRIRKITKRARGAAWDKASDVEVFYTEKTFGRATVRAYTPLRLSEQPQALKKLQVSGLQSENISPKTDDAENYLHVYVDEKLDMSTGKLVAQVGHAVQLFLMYGDETKVLEWISSNQMNIVVEKVKSFPEDEPDVTVHDAGLTEVAAGSLTCVAYYNS